MTQNVWIFADFPGFIIRLNKPNQRHQRAIRRQRKVIPLRRGCLKLKNSGQPVLGKRNSKTLLIVTIFSGEAAIFLGIINFHESNISFTVKIITHPK